MPDFAYDDAPGVVRADLRAAHRRAWARLAAPGTWFTGAERVAIAAEVRRAPDCPLCRARQAALSPYAAPGAHDARPPLAAPLVEAIHRIRTDPGRLKRTWFEALIAGGLGQGEYVEALGVLAVVVAVDTFARAVGVAPPRLPVPEPGEPSRYMPDGLKPDRAWLPMIAPQDAGPAEADLYPGGRATYSRRAMSLVPDAVRGFFDLVDVHYFTPDQQWDFATEYRAISHGQVELIAARVSALNGCDY